MHARHHGHHGHPIAPGPPAGTGPPSLRPLLPLYLVIFVAFCGYSLMVTLFVPMLMADRGGFLPADASLGLRTTTIGALLAIYPLGQFVGSPMIGVLSDRYGRKPVLTASLLIAIVAYAVVAVAIGRHSLALLAAGCLIGGLSESNIAIVQSAVADVTHPEHRARLFAWIYSACSLGYMAGPVGGGQLALRLGYAAPFWATLVLLAATFVWVARDFRETHAAERGLAPGYLATMGALGAVFTDRPIRRLYLINFLFYLALYGYFRVILLWMTDIWRLDVGRSTFTYACLGAASLCTSFGLLPLLSRRFALKTLAIGGAVAGGGAMLAVLSTDARTALWFAAIPASMLGTLVLASCATILANAVAPDRQGRVLGNNQALQVGAEALGSVGGGALAAVLTALPLACFGLLLIGAGLLLAATRVPAPEAEPEAAAAELAPA